MNHNIIAVRFLFIYVDKIYVLYYNYNVYPLVFMIKGIKMFRNSRIKKYAAPTLTNAFTICSNIWDIAVGSMVRCP